jgi:hypothetical protein
VCGRGIVSNLGTDTGYLAGKQWYSNSIKPPRFPSESFPVPKSFYLSDDVAKCTTYKKYVNTKTDKSCSWDGKKANLK